MLIHYKALSLCAAVALTALSAAVVTPAQARPAQVVVTAQRASELPTRRVSYRDLNLASATDQATLQSRVGFAVKQVCGERAQHAEKTLASFTRYSACRGFAWNGARPQVAAAVDRARARALALNGNGAVAVGSLAITISAPAGA